MDALAHTPSSPPHILFQALEERTPPPPGSTSFWAGPASRVQAQGAAANRTCTDLGAPGPKWEWGTCSPMNALWGRSRKTCELGGREANIAPSFSVWSWLCDNLISSSTLQCLLERRQLEPAFPRIFERQPSV